MYVKKFGIGLLIAMILIVSLGIYSFAESSSEGQSVSAETQSLERRRSCFNYGTTTLTEVISRGLAIEADAYAYHDVDKIKITVTLQEKRDGYTNNLTSWSASATGTDYVELNKTKTVEGDAYYRLYAIFSTEHEDCAGTEGGSATTSWMWID